jgi:pyruvate,water dikinase
MSSLGGGSGTRDWFLSSHEAAFFLRNGARAERLDALRSDFGGKTAHLAVLSVLGRDEGFLVPEWVGLKVDAHAAFLKAFAPPVVDASGTGTVAGGGAVPFTDAGFAQLERSYGEAALPPGLEVALRAELEKLGLLGRRGPAVGEEPWVAVRSSAVGEDSAGSSFAGQYASFLYQRGWEQISLAIRRVWASAVNPRSAAYRAARGLEGSVRMGVLVQRMVEPRSAGVAFSRNPVRLSDRESLVVSSVWGVGEGLVSGELEADHFELRRADLESELRVTVGGKRARLVRADQGGLRSESLAPGQGETPSLSPGEARRVARLALAAERAFGCAQDVEWAFSGEELFCLQSRPITGLPPDAHFDPALNGSAPILWDNSNIIESYCGVTSPLTFSHVSRAYAEVYDQFCRVMGVPEPWIARSEGVFRNMLGLVRGRIYYNLMNWYRLIFLFPGAAASQGFMETMMGVKQGLGKAGQSASGVGSLFDFLGDPPRYSAPRKAWLIGLSLYRYFFIRGKIESFQRRLGSVCGPLEEAGFSGLGLSELVGVYRKLEEELLKRWDAPIINDGRCMVAFGFLKALTRRWLASSGTGPDPNGESLQNDLLCGEGDLKSTEPTKLLMRLAESIDRGSPAARAVFLEGSAQDAWKELREGSRLPAEVSGAFREFLKRYGFRCVNELKLEEPDLHDDPSFAIESVRNYVRMGTYDVAAMERREREIRAAAEARVRERLRGPRRWFYFFILRWARRAVSDRENLRFDRTRVFGITRHLFRAMGDRLARLGVLAAADDFFYLTIEEILAFQEGRATQLRLDAVAALRKAEFEEYRRTPAPPDRFLTHGVAGSQFRYAGLLAEADLLVEENRVEDPSKLRGTPCCPGVVEGVVRVARTIQDARELQGEILVTERTDPGWVPLYPSCSGLLIERGSLLSHSAVVARELGIPTIVGIRGGLLQRLKTGDRVRIDAARGEVTLL